MVAGKKNWIQGAIQKPGALADYAKRHHESVKKATKQGLHSKNPKLHKRAVLAKTLSKLRKK